MLLKNTKSEEEKTNLIKNFNLLINQSDMGKRFKLLSIRKFDLKQEPVGFLKIME